MMVPRMQGDIIDAIYSSKRKRCHVLDPFMGSGTVMSESLLRGLDFTGIDINPLAVLVCEAKAVIDLGVSIDAGAKQVLAAVKSDQRKSIDVDFPGRSKWFDPPCAVRFSRLRRAIMEVAEQDVRKVLWTVFAETVRLCSNSRTSTYKLHIRKPDDRVLPNKVQETFEARLRQTLSRINEYRSLAAVRGKDRPSVNVFCDDVRNAKLNWPETDHQILVTSPPYGDNQTTIPYGQFSYLAMRWIPEFDLPGTAINQLMRNTHALDSASLGGTIRGVEVREDAVRRHSSTYDRFLEEADKNDQRQSIRKVSSFVADFAEALTKLREVPATTAHWVITTGNRTACGMTVPLDKICSDLVAELGGKPIATVSRNLPNKRMPSRNSQGVMITAETTNIFEFS